MDGYERRPTVLARIPNLNRSATVRHPVEANPASNGRLLSQAISFKLLAGCVFVLVLAAVIPLLFHRGGAVTGPAPDADLAPAWQPSESVASTEPATSNVPAAAEPSAIPESAQAAWAPKAEQVVSASATVEEPLMSAWPNPLQAAAPQPAAVAQDAGSCANQSMAIRPSEYSRSSHDSTRPGVH